MIHAVRPWYARKNCVIINIAPSLVYVAVGRYRVRGVETGRRARYRSRGGRRRTPIRVQYAHPGGIHRSWCFGRSRCRGARAKIVREMAEAWCGSWRRSPARAGFGTAIADGRRRMAQLVCVLGRLLGVATPNRNCFDKFTVGIITMHDTLSASSCRVRAC